MDELKVIHVAGTKGKGSTCALTESILRHCGYSTGFTSSPHLMEVRSSTLLLYCYFTVILLLFTVHFKEHFIELLSRDVVTRGMRSATKLATVRVISSFFRIVSPFEYLMHAKVIVTQSAKSELYNSNWTNRKPLSAILHHTVHLRVLLQMFWSYSVIISKQIIFSKSWNHSTSPRRHSTIFYYYILSGQQNTFWLHVYIHEHESKSWYAEMNENQSKIVTKINSKY